MPARTLDWDDDLLALLGVDRGVLPTILASDAEIGEAELLGRRLPVRAMAGDQQAALFGQGCHARGEAKVTYGTGSFVLVHAAARRPRRRTACSRRLPADGYALEGAVLVAGAALQWLRDGLGVLVERLGERGVACSVDSTGGVSFGRRWPGSAALVAARCPRADQRADTRHDPRPPRPCRPRGDRPPGGGRRRRVPGASDDAPGRRRSSRERFSGCSFRPISSACPSRSPSSTRRPRSGQPRSLDATPPGSRWARRSSRRCHATKPSDCGQTGGMQSGS